jgi:outer membrane receptor for ferrienterochelin and colicin
LLALELFGTSALGDNNADEAELAFQRGNDHYARQNYQDALASYFLSYRLVANRNVLFNIARCYEALDLYNEAYRYYNDLSREELAPEDHRQVAQALSRIRPQVALIHVTTEPPGAEVFVDREDLGSRGRSPQTLALDQGLHLIRVNREGYRPAEVHLPLVRGTQVGHSFALQLIVGVVELSGSPGGAWVRESPTGPVLSTLPGKISLPPGRRLLYVGHPGFATAPLLVEVSAEKVVPLKVALAPQQRPTGKLVVTSNRANALVRVDGKEAGFTPTVLALPEGEHELEVSARDQRSFSQRVNVVSDNETRLFAELQYAPTPVKAASKSLVSVDDAPASTTLITAEEIRAFGYTTLAEAISAVRGFFATDDRAYTYLGIRGFSVPGDINSRILILWDGHAMNEVWSGDAYAARELNVDLSEVERIEVVRGPGSALYGSGAFFAVINIVPRDSVGSNRHGEAAAAAAAGALGSWRGHATASATATLERSALLSASIYSARGLQTTDLSPRGLVVRWDDERAYNVSARARYGNFSLAAYFNDRQKNLPNGVFQSGPNHDSTRVADSRGFAEVRFDREFSSTNALSLRAYYDAYRYRGTWVSVEGATATDLQQASSVQTDAAKADWVGGEARYRFSLFRHNQLTAGIESQARVRVEQTVLGDFERPTLQRTRRALLSPYLLDEWAIHPRLLVSAGVRLDKYLDVSTAPVSPRLAVILRPYAQGLTKFVAGQAFRAPTVYELFYGDNSLSQRPALNLIPEKITTFELEHSHNLSPNLRLTIAAYQNRIHELMLLTTDQASVKLCGPLSNSSSCLAFQNVPDLLRAVGAEAELRWQAGRFSLFDLSYAYVKLVGNFPVIAAQTPNHLVSARLMLPVAETGVRMAGQATYQSARTLPQPSRPTGEALLLNFALSGELEHLRYFAGINNLLDVRHALPVGSEVANSFTTVYGRTFLVELTVSY